MAALAADHIKAPQQLLDSMVVFSEFPQIDPAGKKRRRGGIASFFAAIKLP
jgi:hypothetical protein